MQFNSAFVDVGCVLKAVRVGIRGCRMRTPGGSRRHPWCLDANSKRFEWASVVPGCELQAVRVGIRGAWMRTPSSSSGHPWVSDVNSKRLEFRIEVRTLKVLEIKYSENVKFG